MAAFKISGSMSRGHATSKHDFREGNDLPQNIDHSLTKDNVTLIDKLQTREVTNKKTGKTHIEHESIESWINRRMQPVIDEYDAKQYPYRKIMNNYKNYCDWHRQKRKTGGNDIPLMESFNFQVGEHFQTKWDEEKGELVPELDENGNLIDSLGAIYYKADDATKAKMREELFIPLFKKELEDFQKKYPHLEVVQATCHFDEPNGTPHMAVIVVPIGENFKQGLSQQVGFGNAIGCDGIERSSTRKDEYQMARMTKGEGEHIKNDYIMKEFQPIIKKYLGGDFELKEEVQGRKHEKASKYRSAAGEIDKQVEQAKQKVDKVLSDGLQQVKELKEERDDLRKETNELKNEKENAITERDALNDELALTRGQIVKEKKRVEKIVKDATTVEVKLPEKIDAFMWDNFVADKKRRTGRDLNEEYRAYVDSHKEAAAKLIEEKILPKFNIPIEEEEEKTK